MEALFSKNEIEEKIKELSREQVIFFTWRSALRILPFLVVKGNFNYWNKKNRLKYLYIVLYCFDVAAYAAHSKSVVSAYAADDAANAANTVSSDTLPICPALAALAASLAANSITDAYVAASKTALISFRSSVNAFNATKADEFYRDIINDIEVLKQGGGSLDTQSYGKVWNNFIQALENEDCDYWAKLITKFFQDGYVKDKEALKLRLSVPQTIRDKGAAEVAKYLIELEKGTTRLNEARIVILGDKGAGKTCIARKLIDPKAPMTLPEESTPGVDNLLWELEKENMNVHIWDFAGHTVTHAVHKFFLAERCLYLLLYDGRSEQTNRLEYWLNHMKNYGGASEAIILVNKRDNHTPKIPVNTLKKEYPIKEVFFFNLKDDQKELKKFREYVADYILHNPSWNVENFPKNYDAVKTELEQLLKHGMEKGELENEFIPIEKFKELARQNDIDNEEDLLSHLHVLGISLWYKDLEKYNALVLNPEWISQGVYQIINYVHETKQYQVSLKDFKLVFAKNGSRYPESKYEFLFELMKHYELAYETNCDKCLVIPHLLEEDQPALLPEFPLGEGLMLRYKSDSDLPPDTISRFIVRHNGQIKKPEIHNAWRFGVILEDGKGSIALVREKDRVITVSVKGNEKTNFINELRSTLNEIFDSYKSQKPDLEYRVERFGDRVHEVDEKKPIWLQDSKVLNHYQRNKPFYDDITNQEIPLAQTVHIYKIERGNVISGSGSINDIDNSVHQTFNFQDCNLNLQGSLSDLSQRLIEKGEAEEAKELQSAANLLKEAEDCSDPKELKRKGVAKRLESIVNELNDEESTLHKTVKGIKKGISIAQDIAAGYNSIAQWAGLPQVPKPFLKKEEK